MLLSVFPTLFGSNSRLKKIHYLFDMTEGRERERERKGKIGPGDKSERWVDGNGERENGELKRKMEIDRKRELGKRRER